jgi:hypothetical protein
MKKALHILLLATVLWMIGIIIGIAMKSTYNVSTLIESFALYIIISFIILQNLNTNERN